MPVNLEMLRREAELLKNEWNRGQWVPYPDAFDDDCRANPGQVAEHCLELVDEMERARAEMHHIMHHFGAMRIQIKDESGRESWSGTLAEWLMRDDSDA